VRRLKSLLKVFLAVGLIDGNSFGLWRLRELSELSNSFLVQIIEGSSKSLNSFPLFSEKLCKIIRRSSGTKTLKFQHRILEKNKSICLDEDKSVFDPFYPLCFQLFVIDEVTRFG
jgi:hypothetical protein